MNVIQGKLLADNLHIGIAVARFYEFITGKLLAGAGDAFFRHGGISHNLDVVWAPGAFEIPLVVKKIAVSRKYSAVVCLGAVIRGATAHFEMVANESAKGVATVALQTGVPIAYGILTTDTIEQAIERAGTKAGNN